MDFQVAAETAPTIPADSLEVFAVARGKAATEKPAPDAQESIGQRLARLRRERGLTQVEIAERLGVAQPVVSDYERGELRLHGELIIKLTQILGVSAEDILGLAKPRPNGTIKNRRLLRRLQEIERLPKRDQQALMRTIDRFLESFKS